VAGIWGIGDVIDAGPLRARILEFARCAHLQTRFGWLVGHELAIGGQGIDLKLRASCASRRTR